MHNLIIYEDAEIYIEKEKNEIPWLKILTKHPYKEIGDMPKELRVKLWNVFDIIEQEMKSYYKPEKINMASFANILPRVHIHVMARFKEDSFFPNPIWGEKMREGKLNLPDSDQFHNNIFDALQHMK